MLIAIFILVSILMSISTVSLRGTITVFEASVCNVSVLSCPVLSCELDVSASRMYSTNSAHECMTVKQRSRGCSGSLDASNAERLHMSCLLLQGSSRHGAKVTWACLSCPSLPLCALPCPASCVSYPVLSYPTSCTPCPVLCCAVLLSV